LLHLLLLTNCFSLFTVKNSAEEFARSVELNLKRSRPSEGICGQDSAEVETTLVLKIFSSNKQQQQEDALCNQQGKG